LREPPYRYRNRICSRRQDSSVGTATGYALDDQVSIPSRRKRFFSSPQRPGGLWGSPSPGALSPGVKLTTQFHLVPRSATVGTYLHFPICLHSMVIKYLSTETNLPLSFIMRHLAVVKAVMSPKEKNMSSTNWWFVMAHNIQSQNQI
jgi:hypothetical protein